MTCARWRPLEGSACAEEEHGWTTAHPGHRCRPGDCWRCQELSRRDLVACSRAGADGGKSGQVLSALGIESQHDPPADRTAVWKKKKKTTWSPRRSRKGGILKGPREDEPSCNDPAGSCMHEPCLKDRAGLETWAVGSTSSCWAGKGPCNPMLRSWTIKGEPVKETKKV